MHQNPIMIASKNRLIQGSVLFSIIFILFSLGILLKGAENNIAYKTQSNTLSNNNKLKIEVNNNIESKLLNDKDVLDSINKDVSSRIDNSKDDFQQLLTQTEINSVIDSHSSSASNTSNSKEESVNSFYDRGLLFSIYQKYDRAIANYDRALTLDPELTLGYYHRGVAREKLGKTARAIEDFQKALSLATQQNDLTAIEMTQQKLDYLVR